MNIASLVLLFFKPRVASLVAVVGSIIYLVVTIDDQLGLLTPLKAPTIVSIIEVVTAIVLLGVFFFASRVYRENSKKKPADLMSSAQPAKENP
ncbi:MAG: hypothetical protein OK439_03785 [Thaumarchaeota archaeon]|nr:hypothetical protein [Nitrososphaerota archaeon]